MLLTPTKFFLDNLINFLFLLTSLKIFIQLKLQMNILNKLVYMFS